MYCKSMCFSHKVVTSLNSTVISETWPLDDLELALNWFSKKNHWGTLFIESINCFLNWFFFLTFSHLSSLSIDSHNFYQTSKLLWTCLIFDMLAAKPNWYSPEMFETNHPFPTSSCDSWPKLFTNWKSAKSNHFIIFLLDQGVDSVMMFQQTCDQRSWKILDQPKHNDKGKYCYKRKWDKGKDDLEAPQMHLLA